MTTIRQRRVEAGLSAKAVARELEVGQPTLSRWEAKEELPRRVAYAVFHAIERLTPQAEPEILPSDGDRMLAAIVAAVKERA